MAEAEGRREKRSSSVTRETLRRWAGTPVTRGGAVRWIMEIVLWALLCVALAAAPPLDAMGKAWRLSVYGVLALLALLGIAFVAMGLRRARSSVPRAERWSSVLLGVSMATVAVVGAWIAWRR